MLEIKEIWKTFNPGTVNEKQALRGIPGTLPDLTNPPEGCVFAPRCPYATEQCRRQRPVVVEHAPGHFAACHRYADKEATLHAQEE